MEKDLGTIKETLDTHIKDQKTDTASLIKKMDDFISAADNKYADGEQFRFWRNLLITGIILSVAVGLIGIWVDKALH